MANELAGTRQAADTHRRTATVRAVEAANTADPAQRADLEHHAAEAAALAATLDERATELQRVEEARGHWLAHTAATRAKADRATAELAARGIDNNAPDDTITATEWLAAHRAADGTEDPHRPVTDPADLTEAAAQRDADLAAVEHLPPVPTPAAAVEADPATETAVGATEVADVRDAAADEPAPVEEDTVRVPTADETANSVQRAQRALAEITARQAAEDRNIAEQRAQQLTRWHADDQGVEQERDRAAERDVITVGGLGGFGDQE